MPYTANVYGIAVYLNWKKNDIDTFVHIDISIVYESAIDIYIVCKSAIDIYIVLKLLIDILYR